MASAPLLKFAPIFGTNAAKRHARAKPFSGRGGGEPYTDDFRIGNMAACRRDTGHDSQ
jgi:hypothetical protein